MESKSDQLALSTVMPPKELLIPGDITSLVTVIAVMTQGPSAVSDRTHPSSSMPVKQEGTVAQPFQVSGMVYEVTEPELGTANMSGGQTQAPSRMSLGTQVDSDLSFTESSSLALPQGTDENPGLCLEVDPTKSTVEIINQICTELQLAWGSVSGGEGLAPLSDEDMTAFE